MPADPFLLPMGGLLFAVSVLHISLAATKLRKFSHIPRRVLETNRGSNPRSLAPGCCSFIVLRLKSDVFHGVYSGVTRGRPLWVTPSRGWHPDESKKMAEFYKLYWRNDHLEGAEGVSGDDDQKRSSPFEVDE